jgi:uncharacterized membrane protein
VFDQINGLPVHALVLHAAVIFVPLLALGGIVYAIVPRWRPKIAWAVFLLAIIAPVCAFVARQSGTKLYARVLARGISDKGKQILANHMYFGTRTFWFTLALGIVVLILVLATARKSERVPRVAGVVLSVATVALALICGYYVFRTGDSGATAVWGVY